MNVSNIVATLETRVDKGIRYLNRTQKGWLSTINIENLDLSSPNTCVLGFVFDSFWKKVVESGEVSKGKQLTFNEAIDRGFALSNKDSEAGLYDLLTGIWVAKLTPFINN